MTPILEEMHQLDIRIRGTCISSLTSTPAKVPFWPIVPDGALLHAVKDVYHVRNISIFEPLPCHIDEDVILKAQKGTTLLLIPILRILA